MTSKQYFWSILVILAAVVLIAGRSEKVTPMFHDEEELLMYRNMVDDLPTGDNSLFTGSGKCAGCHGYDPNNFASITAEGVDVNVTDDWRATMMANAAKDPFWKAKVSHEVAVNPSHQIELENKCTTCHSPLGHFAAFHDGAEFYSMEMLETDSIGRDGVSCNACHQQDPTNIGDFFSGELEFVGDTLYGQMGMTEGEAPIFVSPMLSFVGYLPMYGEHVEKSESCAGCHTLITSTVDLEGNATGNQFVEQATYHEWLNSDFGNGVNQTECQGCHMPRLDEPIVISANYSFLEGRLLYGQHFFIGGNTFMLELMRERIEELGITADTSHFDRVIERTYNLLQNESVTMTMSEGEYDADSVSYTIRLENLTGHKFPSGYPARRAFIEFVVTDEFGNTLFQSGTVQDDYEVLGQNEDYEPHYETIRSEDQVQIYEMVMGDVNGDVTTVLERADYPIKDNRLTPVGFSISHEVYDTTLIAGLALDDLNFNYDDGVEGSGADEITYRIGLDGYSGEILARARFYYQSAPPKWMDEMFATDTPEIEAFKQMYDDEGADPVLIEELTDEMLVVGIEEADWDAQVRLYPNPVSSGQTCSIETLQSVISTLRIYDSAGRLVKEVQGMNSLRYSFTLPHSGTYLIEATSKEGDVFVGRVISY